MIFSQDFLVTEEYISVYFPNDKGESATIVKKDAPEKGFAKAEQIIWRVEDSFWQICYPSGRYAAHLLKEIKGDSVETIGNMNKTGFARSLWYERHERVVMDLERTSRSNQIKLGMAYKPSAYIKRRDGKTTVKLTNANMYADYAGSIDTGFVYRTTFKLNGIPLHGIPAIHKDGLPVYEEAPPSRGTWVGGSAGNGGGFSVP